MCPDSPDFPDSVKTAQVCETMQCICVYKQISTRSHGLIYYTLNVHIYIRYWFKHPRRVTEEGDTQRNRLLILLLSLPLLFLWCETATTPLFRAEEETRRQSTAMETQRISLEAATAGFGYNMAAALVATAAQNLFNKSSIQGQWHWDHAEKDSVDNKGGN